MGENVLGWLVAEFVPYDSRPGGEVLVGLRRTAEFGPVLVLGVGGVHAELLAPSLAPAVLRAGGGEDERERALRASPALGLLADGWRGGPAAARRGELASFAHSVLAAAPGLPVEVAEFEANPVVFTEKGPVALDALVRLGTVPSPAPPRPEGPIDRLLHPRSLAVRMSLPNPCRNFTTASGSESLAKELWPPASISRRSASGL